MPSFKIETITLIEKWAFSITNSNGWKLCGLLGAEGCNGVHTTRRACEVAPKSRRLRSRVRELRSTPNFRDGRAVFLGHVEELNALWRTRQFCFERSGGTIDFRQVTEGALVLSTYNLRSLFIRGE